MRDNFVQCTLNSTTWEIPERYQNLSVVGAGAYGRVCSADDTKGVSKEGVALKVVIKKLARPFQTAMDAKRTYRELRMLKHMHHENSIGLLDVFTPAISIENFRDVYLVCHWMPTDLNNILKTQKLSDDQVQFLVYQILRGMKYVHSAGIIHRDLKPSNIAVNEECELKILDFGLARPTANEMTGYVSTRWYRAPEIMLNWMHYHQAVDIWSVGCIMAEMLTGMALFPGTDRIDQLNRILVLCGTPTEETLDKMTSEEAQNYVRSLPKMERKKFNEVFKDINPLAIDLLDKILNIDSDKRITAAQALAHQYFSEDSDPQDEPNSIPYHRTFEDLDFTVEQWKKYVWGEVQNFLPML